MKRLLVAVLIGIFLVVPALASATTVLYITSEDCAGLSCDCLSGENKLFCSKLDELGYDIIIDTDGDVKDNSVIWKEDFPKADLIFLGDVSESVIDKDADQPAFCTNIKNTNRKVFATFENAYKNNNLEGCAFTLALASYPSDDNVCTVKNLRITDTGYITKGFEQNNITQVYGSTQDVKINYGTTWASAHCDPSAADVPTDLYSAIATSERGTFWGLDKPSDFTDAGWLLFERTILFTTDDHIWNITYFTIPEKVSAGKAFMLFAEASVLAGPITEGWMNASLNDALLGPLTYNNETGYWENRVLSIERDGYLQIEAEDGSVKKWISAGDLDVRIISGSYVPGKLYNVRAKVLFQDNPWAADVKYKLWDSNLSVHSEGDMEHSDGVYSTEISIEGTEELILEVMAQNASLVGGRFKIISSTNVSAEDYTIEPQEWVITATKPGSETMVFKIFAGAELSGLVVEKSGALANYITLDTSMTETELGAGNSTEFSATLDWSGLKEGEKTGEIFVGSDQFSATIPINLAYFALAGEWLEVDKKVLKVEVPEGRAVEETITITNLASLPTTGIKVNASGGLAGMVKFVKEPYYVNASKSKDVELLFDATGKSKGTYSGTITIASSLGSAEIMADVEVTPDLDELLDGLDSEWQEALANLTEGGAELSEEAALVSELVSGNISEARAAFASDDYAEAFDYYDEARANLDVLKRMKPAPGIDLLFVIFVIIVIGVLVYVGWRFLKKRKKKEKKEVELPKAEEQYRTEYY